MAIRLAAWNVAKELGNENKAQDVIKAIESLNADIVILSEAYGKDGLAVTDVSINHIAYSRYIDCQ